MNLAYKYPIIFWNCSCLISDSGGNELEEIETEEYQEDIDFVNDLDDFSDNDEEETEDEEDEEVEASTEKKKKTKATNYGKIAAAIGKIKSAGVKIDGPNINESSYTFSPDVENNTIRFGLSGITRIGDDLIKTIIINRPYSSINDFLGKVKINKPQMINLIKAGAFDQFGDRIKIMHSYVDLISDTKKRITLQNMKMLIDFGLIPDEYDMERRVFNFNKYLKKMKKGTSYYGFDNIAFNFYSNNFDIDLCIACDDTESGFQIKQTDWDKIYKKHMDKIRPYVQKNNAQLLEAVNNQLTSETWNKYCLGSISHWEMSSISCYLHEHELAQVDLMECRLEEFYNLPSTPEIERFVPIKGKQVPIYKLHRIVGTVLDRNKNKKTVTLLTLQGVVTVHIYGNVFAQYDKQISERGADGKKHVIEKSVFSRGNILIITGIKQEDGFLGKKYSRTPYHMVEQIVEIKENGDIVTYHRDSMEG